MKNIIKNILVLILVCTLQTVNVFSTPVETVYYPLEITQPFSGDVDGDNLNEFIGYSEYVGKWLYLSNTAVGFIDWGFYGATAFVGDFNGDGKDDLAVYHLDTGDWYIRDVKGKIILWSFSWGFKNAIPSVGDLDNDGATDLIIFFNHKWYVYSLKNGLLKWSLYE